MDRVDRKAEITIRLSEFEMPPMQDVLLIGRHACIGPEAARRMMDALAPEQYELITIEQGPIEAVVVRRHLLAVVSKEKLLPILLEEAIRLSPDTLVVKGQVDLNIIISRQVSL